MTIHMSPSQSHSFSSLYERGTPQGPLSRRARWTILVLLSVVSSGLASLAAWKENDSKEIVIVTAISTLAGCLSVLVPLITNDWSFTPLVIVDVLTIAALLDRRSLHWNINMNTNMNMNLDMNINLYTTKELMHHSIVVSVLAGIAAFLPQVLQPMVTILCNPVLLTTTTIILAISYAVASCVQIGSPILATLLSILTLILLGLWYYHRTMPHSHSLVDPGEHAMSMVGSLGLLIILSLHLDRIETFLPILLGAIMTILCCATLAAVADVWHSVGSGQFWMISLDTTSMMIYLVAPTILLVHQANNKYGDSIRNTLGNLPFLQQWYVTTPLAMNTAVLLIGISISIGVVLLAMLCPLGAHLFGKVYTRGQASTRKVALCMDWSDDVTEEALQGFPPNQVITFLVTAQHLRQDGARIQAVANHLGHSFVLSADTEKSLHDAYSLYATVFSDSPPPTWSCPGMNAWTPSLVHASAQRNLNVGLWSHGLIARGTTLTTIQAKCLQEDMTLTMGGTIIYIIQNETVSSLPLARIVLTDFQNNNISFCPLSHVAKNDLKMELS